MPATASLTPFGSLAVDAVDSGTKWATNSFTYSFPTSASFYTGAFGMAYGSGEPSSNFKAFTTVQQNATATILGMYSAVANLTFTQVTESSTQSATLRYAESDSPTTAWGYDPSTSPEGGDAWFNNSSHWYDNPAVGNYAWLTIIHETGHLLGLKHPQDTMGSFGAVPASQDSLEYSVMSYRSYTGASTTAGLSNATWSFPTTLMEYDIAALQYMYGANYNTNGGNTIYSWNPNTGQESINGVAQTAPGGNTIFMTIWDGGGTDTYDFSNYTSNLSVNLQPGGWTTTSTAQLANLGSGHYAIGNIANALEYNNNPLSLIENAIGGSGNDTIIGNAADNKLTGGAGNDTIDGVSGTNTAVYSGPSTSYQETQNSDGSWTVTDLRAGSPDGTDTLKNIQYLQFSDKTLALGTLPPPPVIAAPQLVSFSTDTGTIGDNITSDNTLTLNGTAEASSTVKVYDGSTLLGSAIANGSGVWTYTTSALPNGAHSLTATATDVAGNTGVASAALNVTVDTIAPAIPVIASDTLTGKSATLSGTAEAGSTIKVYDGTTLLGSATTSSSGAWSYTTSVLSNGTHGFTATATDAAGNTSTTSTAFSVTKNSAVGDVVQTDLNFDGTADILWRDSNSGTVGTWLMSNGQVLQTNPIGVASSNTQIAGTGDFNNDGTTDILWRDSNTGTVSEWLMSNGQVSQTNTIGAASSNWQIVGTGDFNNDGTTDILWRDSNTGTVGEWLMSNGQVTQGNGIAIASSNLQVAGTGDFNNDGTTDILWRDKNTGTVSEWLMSNGQLSQTSTIGTDLSNWKILGTGDFNNDGTSDILLQDVNTGAIDTFRMSNGQVSQMAYLGTLSSNWQFLGTGDFNNDGTSDMMFRDTNTGSVNEWLMSSNGQVLQSLVGGGATSNWNTLTTHA